MAQPTSGLCAYVCRSCRNSLRRDARGSRQFSTTVQRPRTIPVFIPTTSPDLNNLLKEWRQKVFTPAVLASHHQALIYKKSRHDILKNDPGVTVTLSNDEDVKLEPMNRFDQPNKLKSLSEMARILGSTSDPELWANLQPFLEGMKTAKYEIPVAWREKITRKSNEQGKHGIILQCAAMVKKTDMRLSLRGVTRELMLGCHERAVKAGFKGEATAEAAKTANRIVVMLEDKEHCGGKLEPGHADMRRDPFVFAVLLEFAAEKALHLNKGKDIDGEVGKLVSKLLMLAESPEGVIPNSEATRQQFAIEESTVLYNAIEMALKVDIKSSLGKDHVMTTTMDLKKLSTELESNIREMVSSVEKLEKGKPQRALAMWEKTQEVQKNL